MFRTKIMKTLTDENKIEFFRFLNDERSIQEMENFIYSQTELQEQLDNLTYLNLIELNFKDIYIKAKLTDLIKTRIVKTGQFETWRLIKKLNEFLTQPEKIDHNLVDFYHLFYGVYQENGKRSYEYKFLGVLALNYFHWAETGYLKSLYGFNWELEYAKCQNDFNFYHKQLKGFATEILFAIEHKEIEIFDNGTYKISTYLKNKYESNEVYKLNHPNSI